MSHSDNENKEPKPEESTEQETNTEDSEVKKSKAPPLSMTAALKPKVTSNPVTPPASDRRLSRLAKMQSQYVTEEALQSTVEKAAPPKRKRATEEDEEFYDDEEFDDFDEDEFEDDEEFEEYDDDFEDDDYEDDELVAEAENDQQDDKEDEAGADSNEDSDHKLAELRKLQNTFVSEKDLEIKDTGEEPEVFKETKVAKVICPNCHSEEPRTRKICGSCGAKLPNITSVQEETYNPGTLNQAVLKYFDAVKQLKDKAWTPEEFLLFLQSRLELSTNHIDELYELLEECGANEWLPDATKLIMESTQLLESSIEHMENLIFQATNEQIAVDQEYDEILKEFIENEDPEADDLEPPEPPMLLAERIRNIDFQPDLDNINKANDLMLKTLRLIDDFQKQSNSDLEVSM